MIDDKKREKKYQIQDFFKRNKLEILTTDLFVFLDQAKQAPW
jgi:hypothetical protein